MDAGADDGTNNRRQPKQPELLDGPAASEEYHAGRARRVDRGVGDRDQDQMDQRQRQTDGNGCKASRNAFAGRAQNDGQEHGGQNHFGDQIKQQGAGPN